MTTMSPTAFALTTEPPPQPNARQATVHRRVLLGEDDDDFRSLIAEALRGDGYLVVEAGTGRELLDGLERVARHADDECWAVVSDVRMPELTGLEVLTALRMARWKTPVLLMTAFGDDELHDDAAELGAMVVDKPFELDALRTQVARLFEST